MYAYRVMPGSAREKFGEHERCGRVARGGTCFWIFIPSWIQSGEETDVGRQRLNRALESLVTFTLLVCKLLNKTFDTNDYNWWRVLIFLPQEPQTLSDLSSACNILLAITTHSQVRLCENHIKPATLIWELKQVLGSNMISLRTKFNTQTKTTVISHRKRNRFSSSAGLLFRSEFSDRWHTNTGFGYIKSIPFLHFPR